MKLNNKGFSLVEILITVGLIGTLTAIAVPSYQKYQASAKVTVVSSSISRIKTSFAACLATDSFANCAANVDIQGTLQSQSGAAIDHNLNGNNVCWEVSVGAGGIDGTGCVGFQNDNTGTPVTGGEIYSFPKGTPCNKIPCTVAGNNSDTTCTTCGGVGCTEGSVPSASNSEQSSKCTGGTSISASTAVTCGANGEC